MHWSHCDVFILCDGEPVEEYCTEVENTNTISCYIASEAGKSFSVQWRNDLRDAAAVNCFMDGRHMGCSKTLPGCTRARAAVRTGSDTRQGFLFASLVTTDDDDIANPDDPTVNDIGTIEVYFYRVELVYDRNAVVRPFRPRDVPVKPAPIHERSKKAGAHCILLGEETRFTGSYAPPRERTIYIDRRERPYIRFIFRYKPREILQAQGIIPPDLPRERHETRESFRPVDPMRDFVEPSHYEYVRWPLEAERASRNPVYDVDDRDDRYVENMLRAQSVNSEHATAPAPIKQETRRPHIINLDTEVIDLTMDSDSD